MLTRGAERRGRPPPQPVYDDFKPQEEWVQEPSNYIFRLYLPQVFKKEELNITYDQSGKITVRGRKLVGENRFARFETSSNVPKDSNLENVSGKLENNILALTIPKIVIAFPSEEKKEEPLIKEIPKMVAEKKEEPLLKTELDAKEKINEAASLKKLNGKLQTMKEPNLEERKNEANPNEIKKEEPIVKEKLNNFEEKKEAIQKDKPVFDGNKKEDSTKKDETWEEEKQPKERESRKRKWVWNEEDKGWLDWLDCDEVLKRVCRNKKLITLALVALTAGFYISRKREEGDD